MKFALAAALAIAATPMAAWADNHEEPASEAPVEVMVLGVYHFANPGLDLVNVEVDDVMAPQRQAELQAITDALAEWRPTRILLESEPDTADLHIPGYRNDPARRVAEDSNENFQLGYRLALQLGHSDIYGFDEQGGEGEPDYFPIQAVEDWAVANGAEDDFAATVGQIQVLVEDMSADDATCSIARNLIQHNDPELTDRLHSAFYYGVLAFGDAQQQPGAELNAYWYLRNAKMFAKVGLVAEPGDRVLIIVGSGHRYWLDHFASETPGYTNVDPRPWLEMADDGRCES